MLNAARTSLSSLQLNSTMELDKDTIERLLDAMLFCLGPYLENDGFREENPWLFELAESYNEIVSQLPQCWRMYQYEPIQY